MSLIAVHPGLGTADIHRTGDPVCKCYNRTVYALFRRAVALGLCLIYIIGVLITLCIICGKVIVLKVITGPHRISFYSLGILYFRVSRCSCKGKRYIFRIIMGCFTVHPDLGPGNLSESGDTVCHRTAIIEFVSNSL